MCWKGDYGLSFLWCDTARPTERENSTLQYKRILWLYQFWPPVRPVKKADYMHGFFFLGLLNSWHWCPIIKVCSIRDQFRHQQKPQLITLQWFWIPVYRWIFFTVTAEYKFTEISPNSGKCLESENVREHFIRSHSWSTLDIYIYLKLKVDSPLCHQRDLLLSATLSAGGSEK